MINQTAAAEEDLKLFPEVLSADTQNLAKCTGPQYM